MTKKFYPVDVLEQAQEVLIGWGQVSTTLAFGTLNAAALTADINVASPIEFGDQQARSPTGRQAQSTRCALCRHVG